MREQLPTWQLVERKTEGTKHRMIRCVKGNETSVTDVCDVDRGASMKKCPEVVMGTGGWSKKKKE